MLPAMLQAYEQPGFSPSIPAGPPPLGMNASSGWRVGLALSRHPNTSARIHALVPWPRLAPNTTIALLLL